MAEPLFPYSRINDGAVGLVARLASRMMVRRPEEASRIMADSAVRYLRHLRLKCLRASSYEEQWAIRLRDQAEARRLEELISSANG